MDKTYLGYYWILVRIDFTHLLNIVAFTTPNLEFETNILYCESLSVFVLNPIPWHPNNPLI